MRYLIKRDDETRCWLFRVDGKTLIWTNDKSEAFRPDGFVVQDLISRFPILRDSTTKIILLTSTTQLKPLNATHKARDGETVDVWLAGSHCPCCGRYRSAGKHIVTENLFDCEPCGQKWELNKQYLRIVTKFNG